METNLFGAFWVTQAALPFLREQGSGHILQVSSIGGISAFPNIGAYHASKWALEGFSQALAQEVAGFGIHVTLVEPGGFSTDWAGSSARHATPLPAYDEFREQMQEARAKRIGTPGDPTVVGRRDPAGRRRRAAAAARVLRRLAARHREGRLRVAHRDLGAVGRRRRSWRRADRGRRRETVRVHAPRGPAGRHPMKVFASYNIKGGVGKTSTVVNLAHLSAQEGRRTLLWDLDPQGAATYMFRVRRTSRVAGTRLVTGKRPIEDAIRATDFGDLDLLPADFSYRNLDLELDDAKKRTRRLRQLIDEHPRRLRRRSSSTARRASR